MSLRHLGFFSSGNTDWQKESEMSLNANSKFTIKSEAPWVELPPPAVLAIFHYLSDADKFSMSMVMKIYF